MTEKIKFRLIITIPVILFSAMIITIYLRFIKLNPLGTFIMVLLIGGVYFFAMNLISSRRINLFSSDSIPKPDKVNDLMDYYKAIGGTPLKTLILFLLLAFAYMTGLFLYLSNHQVATNIAMTFLGLVFSSIMLCSSFAYVLLDKLIISFLYRNNIYSYPAQLIESRQKSKNIIIPVFMSLMTMIYSLNLILITHFSQNLDNLISVYKSIGIFLFIFLIIMSPLVVIWARGTAQLYGQINDRLEEMVTGEKDLTKRINICSVDEMSTLSNRINLFSDIINDHMVETGSIFAKLNQNQISLSENITISSESVKEISHHINVLTSNVENEYAMVKDTLDTGKSLISDLEDVVRHVNDQSVSVSESSAAVEEMIASITEVSRRTLNVKEKTSEMTKRFSVGQEKIDKTVHSVSNVVQYSKSLVEINTLISGIAAQTNLLAMNAAIEAAHAGEAGKGFSVVADEIRKLAENTASHTKTSSENLKQILGEIDISLKVAEETGVIFGEMKEGITLIDDESYSISETMTEHDRANKQVLEQLSETNKIADKLSTGASLISDKGNSMLSSLHSLESSAGKSFEHCSSVNQQNNAIKENIEELLSLSKETDEINKRTQELVNSFKLD